MKRLYIDNIDDFNLAINTYKCNEYVTENMHYHKYLKYIKILIKNDTIIDFCYNEEKICSLCYNHTDKDCLDMKSDNFINFNQYMREVKLNRILND